jgi:N-acetylglutamate synthase-like GNAT family acetyltransferase
MPVVQGGILEMIFHIRPAQIKDIRGVRQVAKETWTDTYKTIYSMDFINRFLDHAYSETSLEQSIRKDEDRPERHFFVAESEQNEVIGYAHVRPEGPGVYELLRIYVSPPFQGSGAGSALLQEIKNQITSLNKLRAWVERKNMAGRRFYEKKGFQAAGEKTETVEGTAIQLVCYERNYNN